jgi:glucokinase
VDIGGTSIRTILATSEGEVFKRLERNTPVTDSPKGILRAIEEEITTIRRDIHGCSGIGIACPGTIDMHRQLITTVPNLPGLSYFPLTDKLSERFETTTRIGNDLTLAGLGEHRFGAGKGATNMIFVGVGTGIGGGIIINNQIYLGKTGSAGEIGHIIIEPNGPKCGCGNRGCLEAIASGSGLEKIAKRRIEAGENSHLRKLISPNSKWKGTENIFSSKSIFEEAAKGDILSKSIISNGARALGTGLATLVNLFNPEIIVIGGGLVDQWTVYIQPAIKEMNRLAFPQPTEDTKIVQSSLKGLAGALGAITLVAD